MQKEKRIRQLGNAALAALSLAALSSFAAIFWMVRQGPLYHDEINWLLQGARIPYDAYRMINLYPDCVSNATWPVPLLLMPGRLFAAALHPETLFGVRLLGMSKYLFCVALLAAITYWLFERRFSLWLLLAASASLLGLGFMPAALLFARPETALLIGVFLLIALKLLNARAKRNGALMLSLSCFAGELSWLFSLHPKTQLLIPFILVLALSMKAPGRISRIVFLAAVLAMAASSIALWREQPRCPSEEHVQAFLKGYSLVPEMLADNPTQFLADVLWDVDSSGERYFKLFTTHEDYFGLYHGFPHVNAIPSLLNNAASLSVHALLIIFGALICLAFGASIIRSGGPTQSEFVLPAWLPWLMLLPAAEIIMTKRNPWSYWEAGWMWALAWLAIVLHAARFGWHRRYAHVFYTFFVGLMCAALLSQAAFRLQWQDFYAFAAKSENIPHGFIEQTDAFQAIGDDAERQSHVREAAEMCHIPQDQTAEHVVVDDWTYLPLRKTFQPFYGRYLFWNPPSHSSLVQFLKDAHSSGMVALCAIVPDELKAIAVEHEGICCIGPEQLKEPH